MHYSAFMNCPSALFCLPAAKKKGVPSAVGFPHCAGSGEGLSLSLKPYPHKCAETGARTRDLPVTDGRLYNSQATVAIFFSKLTYTTAAISRHMIPGQCWSYERNIHIPSKVHHGRKSSQQNKQITHQCPRMPNFFFFLFFLNFMKERLILSILSFPKRNPQHDNAKLFSPPGN